jgi:hypothetical protein
MTVVRFLLAVICGLRAVLVYGEAPAMADRPWALEMCDRLRDRLHRRPAPQPAAEPVIV